MFEIELTFFIYLSYFYKHTCQKNICRNHAKSKILKNFQTIMEKIFEHIFKLPSLPPIQCCPKERKFAGLIDTEVVNTHKQHWKCGRGGFSQNILYDCRTYIWFQVTVANRITIRFWIAGASRVALWSRITISIGNTNLISNYC